MYQIGKIPGSIDIGYVGETAFRKIEIDMTEWMKDTPNGVPSIVHVRPGEEKTDAYVAVTEFDPETNVLTWVITASDIGTLDGDGDAQIWLEEEGDDEAIVKRGKSKHVKTHVNESADNPSSTTPSSQESFIEQITAMKTAAVNAKEAAEDAQADAEAAQAAAEQAATDAENVNLHPAYINTTNKHWMVYDATNHAYTDTQILAEGTDGTDATPDLICLPYEDLTFPVAKGTLCYHGQDLCKAKQDILTSEEWTAAHWDVTNIDAELSIVKNAIQGTDGHLDELAEKGFYSTGSGTEYYTLTSGMGNNVNGGYVENSIQTSNNTGYVIVPKNLLQYGLYYDNTKYKVNTVFVKGVKQVNGTYTAWQTTSPIQYTEPADYDSIFINVRRLSGNMTAGELTTALYRTAPSSVGNLATKAFVESFIPRGLKCIYPDDFDSRIMPDIYNIGRFVADIDPADYKISGEGEVWVATDGNDTTGDGTESKPYATITKALTTDAVTIHIKAGTYTQGTHYTTSANFGGKNVIGHGNVVLQNDSSGHYPYSAGSAYIENITVKHGNATTNQAYHATCTGSGQTVCFVNCVFRDGGGNGLSVTGIDAICIGCVSYGNRLDGFNYHAKEIDGTTYIPNALEIDCVAYNNGSAESGNDSCNGSTAHEGVQIVRINGEYHDCYGGVIAEIAEAYQDTTISVNFGVLAHDSTGTSTYKASFWASKNTKMYLYDCSCYGGTYDLSAIDQASIISRRLTTGRDVPSVNQGASSTVLQY